MTIVTENKLEVLKSEKFEDSSLSCYDILGIDDTRRLGSLASNESILRVVRSEDFLLKFTIYGLEIVEKN